MKRPVFTAWPLAFVIACGPPSSDANPPVLWLAANGDETHVLLQDHEPNPY